LLLLLEELHHQLLCGYWKKLHWQILADVVRRSYTGGSLVIVVGRSYTGGSLVIVVGRSYSGRSLEVVGGSYTGSPFVVVIGRTTPAIPLRLLEEVTLAAPC
jgi:hypothetical protein